MGWIAPQEVPYLVAYLVVAVAVAAAATLAAGAIGKWRYPRLAVLFGSLVIPAALLGFAAYFLIFVPDGPPPNDAKAMTMVFLFMASALTYPFTAASSFVVARWARAKH